MQRKERTTYPTGPLSYSRMVQAVKEALAQEFTSYGLDPSEREKRRLFWRDDMENYSICKWYPRTNVAVAYVNDAPPWGAFEGDYVLRISSATTLNPTVEARFGRFPNGKATIDARWWKNINIEKMRFAIDLFDSITGRLIYGNLQWRADTERWQYVKDATGIGANIPGGGGTEFPEGREPIANDTWNHARATFDFENNIYSLLESNGKSIDLSPFNLPLINISTPLKSRTKAVLAPFTYAFNQPAYVDDVRIYINEV